VDAKALIEVMDRALARVAPIPGAGWARATA
jgi:hypothetical protein